MLEGMFGGTAAFVNAVGSVAYEASETEVSLCFSLLISFIYSLLTSEKLPVMVELELELSPSLFFFTVSMSLSWLMSGFVSAIDSDGHNSADLPRLANFLIRVRTSTLP